MSAAEVVLVTGAARRIGASIARRLHGGGWRVAIHCAHSRNEADALCASLNAARPGSADVVQADLREPDAAPKLVAAVTAALGAPAALVNNASSYFATPLGQITAAAIDELVATNLKSPLLLIQAAQAAGALRSVVNLLDVHSRDQPRVGFAPYTAAKAGLWTLTEALAVEMAPAVRVNGVALGHIAAETRDPPREAERIDLIDKALQRDHLPLGRFGTPEDVAAAVAWLLSAEASYVSGAVLAVDGARRLV